MTRRIAIILSVLFAVVVAVATVFTIKAQADTKFDRLFADLNASELRSAEFAIDAQNNLNQINKNNDSLSFDDKYNYSAYQNKINSNRELTEKLSGKLQNFCDNFKRDYFDHAEIPENGNVVLLSKEKKDQLAELRKLLEEREKINPTCAGREASIALLRFNNDILDANNKLSLTASTNYKDVSKVEHLATYAKGTYKIKDLDKIESFYGKATKDALVESLKIPALFYESYQAFKKGNPSLSDSKFSAFSAASSKATNLFEKAGDEYRKKAKKENSSSLANETNLFNLLKKIGAGKDNYNEALWTSDLLATALASYSTDHDDTFTKAKNTNELVEILKKQNYLTVDNLSLQDISYSFKSNKQFSLTFKLAGKSYIYTVVIAK